MTVLPRTDACASRPLSQACQHGGYQDPSHCDRCICPDGFSGTYCHQLAPSDGLYRLTYFLKMCCINILSLYQARTDNSSLMYHLYHCYLHHSYHHQQRDTNNYLFLFCYRHHFSILKFVFDVSGLWRRDHPDAKCPSGTHNLTWIQQSRCLQESPAV